MKTLWLYAFTALAEIVGCYLPWLWLRQGGSAWLLLPAAISLALFAWLLTLHDAASGRVYAAYGGVYIGAAISWLWAVVAYGLRPGTWRVSPWHLWVWGSSRSSRADRFCSTSLHAQRLVQSVLRPFDNRVRMSVSSLKEPVANHLTSRSRRLASPCRT